MSLKSGPCLGQQLQPCTCGSSCWRTPPEGHRVQSKLSRRQQAPSSGTHGPSHHGCLGSRGQGSRTPRGAGSPARLPPNHRARLQSWLPNITEEKVAPPPPTPLGFWSAKTGMWRWCISGLLRRAVTSSWLPHVRFGYRKAFAFWVQPGVRLKEQTSTLSSLFPLPSQNLVLLGI